MGFLVWVRFNHVSSRAGFVFIMKIPLETGLCMASRVGGFVGQRRGGIFLSQMRSREVWDWGEMGTQEAGRSLPREFRATTKTIRECGSSI